MPIYIQIIAKKLNYLLFQEIQFGQLFMCKLNNYTCGVFCTKPRQLYIRDFPDTQIIISNPRVRIKNL